MLFRIVLLAYPVGQAMHGGIQAARSNTAASRSKTNRITPSH
jgi:hypothetical protein